jgi:hypothetical protein
LAYPRQLKESGGTRITSAAPGFVGGFVLSRPVVSDTVGRIFSQYIKSRKVATMRPCPSLYYLG